MPSSHYTSSEPSDRAPPGRPGPFSLADPDYTRSLLEATGFTVIAVDDLRELMWFGDTPDDAFRLITSLGPFAAMLRNLESDTREMARAELRASINAHNTADGVQYPSAMWLVTAARG